ncbi:MAG TPA: HAMP domain-containing sensor histidine kinase [Nitrososphaeraceae archaeon]|nr:HAMP domain-containing sensor histidine kinase [Nitrososphaeraceae archaeon]
MNPMLNLLQRAKSKVILKITLLVLVEISLICGSFYILTYYQSQGTSIGKSINAAGKNRYLTSISLFETEKFLDGSSNILTLKTGIDNLESNIQALAYGGAISGANIKSIPPDFSSYLNNVMRDFSAYKALILGKIIGGPQGSQVSSSETIPALKKNLESSAANLVRSSDILVTALGSYADNNSQNLIILQIFLAVLNIGILILILYLVTRILRPISLLTLATREIKKGNLSYQVEQKSKDELGELTDSFNSMISSIRIYIDEQRRLSDELKTANDEIAQRERMKDEFINVAAHEMRTPVQPILGLSELLKSKKHGNNATESDREEEELLDMIISNAKRLLLLEENILDVSRLENKILKLNKEQCDLTEIISNAIHDADNQIDKNMVELRYNTTESKTLLFADRAKLTQVVSNLLNNAIKVTKSGSITVNLEKDYNQAIISVKDTGPGIDPAVESKLFMKFVTSSSSGTGLGLFISKSIVEAHGGTISAYNNTNGNGATFTFTLPLLDNNHTQDPEA